MIDDIRTVRPRSRPRLDSPSRLFVLPPHLAGCLLLATAQPRPSPCAAQVAAAIKDQIEEIRTKKDD